MCWILGDLCMQSVLCFSRIHYWVWSYHSSMAILHQSTWQTRICKIILVAYHYEPLGGVGRKKCPTTRGVILMNPHLAKPQTLPSWDLVMPHRTSLGFSPIITAWLRIKMGSSLLRFRIRCSVIGAWGKPKVFLPETVVFGLVCEVFEILMV